MKIKFKFFGLGYDDKYQARVFIYDSLNNLIFDGQTYNGNLCVNLIYGRVYRIVAFSLNDRIDTYFYIDGNREYCLGFSYALVSNTVVPEIDTITFLLTDYYYSNLPIERGDLILWQK